MSDLICYCFGYNSEDIEQDFLSNGKSTIFERIMAEKQAGECQCADKNPKGRWCLSDVRQVVDKVAMKSNAIPIFKK